MNRKYLFLAKIKNSDERDCVYYFDTKSFMFESEDYFCGLRLSACFSGFEKKLKDIVKNNFDMLETTLTKSDFEKLFITGDSLKELAYGISRDSEMYHAGIRLADSCKDIINKLYSKENKICFEKVISEEKGYCMKKYDLSYDEVKEVFDNYGHGYHDLGYRDRGIIGDIFKDFDDMVYEERFNFGYEDAPYFDEKAFGEDLIKNGEYYTLESGKIVKYKY